MNQKYPKERTALLFIDPYNDFLSEGGKFWPLVRDVAAEVDLLDNLRAVTAAIRHAGIQVFIVPHRRWEPGDYDNWEHPNPWQIQTAAQQIFANGSWGGEWHHEFVPLEGDIIVREHWGSSGFANTDLDFRLRQRGIGRLILIGLLANTCVESTAKFAVELGYHVTLVKDATAAFDRERMRSAHELNGPTFAHEIVTTKELLNAIGVGAPEEVALRL